MINHLFPSKGIRTRIEEDLPPIEFERVPTNPMSFGKEFNLIRAVIDYAPERVKDIDRRLSMILKETEDLQREKDTLEKLLAVVK